MAKRMLVVIVVTMVLRFNDNKNRNGEEVVKEKKQNFMMSKFC